MDNNPNWILLIRNRDLHTWICSCIVLLSEIPLNHLLREGERGSQLLKGCSPRQCSNNRNCDRSASLTAQRTQAGKWRPGREGQTAFRANFPTKAADPRTHLRRAATELPGYPLTNPPPLTLPYGRAHRNRLCRLCAPLPQWHILHINIVVG